MTVPIDLDVPKLAEIISTVGKTGFQPDGRHKLADLYEMMRHVLPEM
jgi:hypothetical protein